MVLVALQSQALMLKRFTVQLLDDINDVPHAQRSHDVQASRVSAVIHWASPPFTHLLLRPLSLDAISE